MRFWLPGGPSPATLGALLSACRELDRAGQLTAMAMHVSDCPYRRPRNSQYCADAPVVASSAASVSPICLGLPHWWPCLCDDADGFSARTWRRPAGQSCAAARQSHVHVNRCICCFTRTMPSSSVSRIGAFASAVTVLCHHMPGGCCAVLWCNEAVTPFALCRRPHAPRPHDGAAEKVGARRRVLLQAAALNTQNVSDLNTLFAGGHVPSTPALELLERELCGSKTRVCPKHRVGRSWLSSYHSCLQAVTCPARPRWSCLSGSSAARSSPR